MIGTIERLARNGTAVDTLAYFTPAILEAVDKRRKGEGEDYEAVTAAGVAAGDFIRFGGWLTMEGEIVSARAPIPGDFKFGLRAEDYTSLRDRPDLQSQLKKG